MTTTKSREQLAKEYAEAMTGHQGHDYQFNHQLAYLAVYDAREPEIVELQGEICRLMFESTFYEKTSFYNLKSCEALQARIKRLRLALEEAGAAWCKHPGIRLSTNQDLNRDWCGQCSEWIYAKDGMNPAQKALAEDTNDGDDKWSKLY